jgi:type I restriction enzyme S subunit
MNKNWPRITLADISSKIGSGATPRGGQKSYKSSGVSLIRSMNVYDFNFDEAGLAFIDNEQAAALSNVVVERNDILLNITGASVARCCMVPERILPARVNQHVSIVRLNPDRASPHYVMYVINSLQYKNRLLAIAQGGATREALTKEKIEKFEIPLPSPRVQRIIASILSAYDDLIENNTRRIALLEEMAQLIYREWFVHFRFPGHEGVKMVNSDLGPIPEGWGVHQFSDVCNSIMDGDWIETKDQGGDDYRLLQVSNIGVGEFRETGKFRYISQETFERLNCTEVKEGDILISRMPKPIGRSWLVGQMPWRMITAVDVAIVRTNEKVLDTFYCVHLLNSSSILKLAETLATGTTRPRITRRSISAMTILVPPPFIQQKYSELVSIMYDLSNTLRREIINLQRTRDLLLPRLVSGRMDVGDLEIPSADYSRYREA